METAQKLIDFTNTYYFIKFWTKTTIFDVIRIIFRVQFSVADRLDLCMFQVCLWKINAFIFKQCDMNRLSINAKKDEKSPFPLENNELGMNFKY